MQAILNRDLLPTGMTKEKAVSLGASIAVNLAMIVAFASIANIDAEKIEEGASLVVIGLSGSESDSDKAESKPAPSLPAPPPAAKPAHQAAMPEVPKQEPAQQKIALLDPADQVADKASAPAQPPAESKPSPDQLREAAEQQHRAQEAAARARAEQAQAEAQAQAKAAASSQAASAGSNGGPAGYGSVFIRHIRRFQPPNRFGAGVTRVRASLDGNGNVLASTVIKSSGSAPFDREALQTVRRASPFPKPPGGEARSIDFDFTGRGST